jgi:hypothetical protein
VEAGEECIWIHKSTSIHAKGKGGTREVKGKQTMLLNILFHNPFLPCLSLNYRKQTSLLHRMMVLDDLDPAFRVRDEVACLLRGDVGGLGVDAVETPEEDIMA